MKSLDTDQASAWEGAAETQQDAVFHRIADMGTRHEGNKAAHLDEIVRPIGFCVAELTNPPFDSGNQGRSETNRIKLPNLRELNCRKSILHAGLYAREPCHHFTRAIDPS